MPFGLSQWYHGPRLQGAPWGCAPRLLEAPLLPGSVLDVGICARGCQAGTGLSPSPTRPLAVAPWNPEQPVGLSPVST